ncbi:MAG: type II toxin-antitoxin system VapC family toxin [Verrucomicrobiaceae bacterium]|nr:type II toxin-antitoxin system VapC family toxin [Verrucomicrobiaceae bacterium]
MKPRLYMETTIPSLLTARPSRLIKARAQQEDTRLWWDKMADRYQIYVSDVVHQEAAVGEKQKAFERLAIVEAFPFLQVTNEVTQLAEAIELLGVIPEPCANDAAHLALSVVHKMDYLLTWNMKHICSPISSSVFALSASSQAIQCP